MGMLVDDMFTQVENMAGNSVEEDFEFSGVSYRLHANSIGQVRPKAFLLVAVKQEEAEY